MVAVKAGASHSLALRADGVVVGWGGNFSGQISVPSGATNVVSISAGGNHSLALKANGSVLAWGLAASGQTSVPVGATNVIAVAGGFAFSLVLKADGTVLAWGAGASGQTNIPPTATNLIAIAAGGTHALAVKADGTVIGWGSSGSGQTNPPPSATNVIAVAGGQLHSLALRANGTVVGWGDNNFGQINIPTNATNVVAIAASSASGIASMALRADGTVLMWGGNNVILTNVPPAASNVVAIAMGTAHALAVRVVPGTPPFALLDRPNLFTSGLLGTEHAADFQAGGMRVLRLEPDNGSSLAGNIIGGYVSNSVSPTATGGNTIAGGGFSGGVNSILDNARGNFIGAGSGNQIGSGVNDSVIGGGLGNTILSSQSVIGGGYSNLVGLSSQNSFAAGNRAQALHAGAFVWADAQNASFASTTNNSFNIRASGGVRLNEDTTLSFGSTTGQRLLLYGTDWGLGLQSGVQYSRVGPFGAYAWYRGGVHNDTGFNAGGGDTLMTLSISGLAVNGMFLGASDRNVKSGFEPVDARAVLEKVAALPIQRWHYTNDASTPHLGPVAQDFYAAFGVGPDDKHIATVDADGVALAAIQGLNQKVEEKEQRIRDLEKSLRELQQLVRELAAKKGREQ